MSSIGLLKKWWKTWRTFPVIAWVKAAAYYRSGKFAQAEKFYKKGLEKAANHPASFCARIDLSYCLFKLGKIDEAEAQLRQVTTTLPNSREAHVRLARLLLWSGQSLEAAWTVRRALRFVPVDADLIGLLLIALLENSGPNYLIQEAVDLVKSLDTAKPKSARLDAALARLALLENEPGTSRYEQAWNRLSNMATREGACFEAILLFAEVLLDEDKIAHARRELRRAMTAAPDYPRVQSLLAQSYLKAGAFYQPDYARQLALSACQATHWVGPREMHVLAEAYYHIGDKISALLIASKAKQVGSRLLGSYPGVRNLDKLIETLSEGTQA